MTDIGLYNGNDKYPVAYGLYNFKNKAIALRDIIRYMLDRTVMLFEYEGLPDTIPARDLELMIQTRGHAVFYPYEGDVWAASGGLGGEPNPYLMPTLAVFAVPAFHISRQLIIDEECVVIPNDSTYTGLLPMLRKYGTLLVENELSIRTAVINSRLISIISAPTDALADSARKYIKEIEDGNLSVMGDRALIEGIKTQPYSSSGQSNNLTQLIELEQYVKASLFNELGINANWNAKRETLNDGELAVNNQMLLPLIDDMLHRRRLALEKFNNMFGFNATVRFGSAWEDIERIVKKIDEGPETDPEPDDNNEGDDGNE